MNKMFQVKDITYDLRVSNIACQPKFNKITYGNKTFSYYGTHIWNSLPNNIKESTSLDNFKTNVKSMGRSTMSMQYVLCFKLILL